MKKLLLLAVLGACGSDSIAIDNLAAAYAEATCAKIFACCNMAEEMQLGMFLGFTDQASCVTSFKADLDEEIVEAKVDINEGDITYNGESAADCVSQIEDASCTDTFLGAESCRRIFRGKLANGTACADDELCSSGYCEPTSDTTGVCKNIPGEGDMCQGVCSGDLTCSESTGTCVDRKPNGQACMFGDECQSGNCNEMDVCADQTACDGNDTN